nr:NAD(P)/FAD-dependent oxidoreductase [Brevundimonas sp. A19_0]
MIVGAGAAGMMAAIEAGRRGRSVRIIDHARAPGEKIRISGGGRCNFTNLGCGPHAFLGRNPRFATSALKRFTQQDFIKRVDQAGIAWHEKTLGQLFCDDSAKQIIRMLTDQMRDAGVALSLGLSVDRVTREADGFVLSLSDGTTQRGRSLVLATGGKSIPKMGATDWALDTARAFDLAVTETRPALVPLTFEPGFLSRWEGLSGVSVEAEVAHTLPKGAPRTGRPTGTTRFREGLLFTHRGLSGPSILQISSYWREGEAIRLDLVPEVATFDWLKAQKQAEGRRQVTTILSRIVPQRLAERIAAHHGLSGNMADLPDKVLARLAEQLNQWTVTPVGSEGYRTAEVMLGGVDTAELDQTTMEARRVPGLFIIGEAVDITGWLGGYNFQWAWSSGWAAGQVV